MWVDRRAARWFWYNWADTQHPSDEFVEGFVEGALDALDEAETPQ
jgi:hypothetical protein